MDELLKRIGSVKRRIEKIIPNISEEIDSIVDRKIESQNRIESILDQLLDFSMMGVGSEQFERLNKYYSSINAEAAEFYRKQYQEV